MKHILKGVVVLAAVMIVDIIINIICNINGVDLDSTMTSIVLTFSAIMIYQEWIKSEKDKNDKNEK